ncbi:MAG: hypothetical protein BWY71_02287 [Planctomycetes bacterium ADurb.Bin412]|nr:MAG: hypothetical protein BWY71_02287 [Planctomycetes bacterium ADurb.Bin412]
MPQQASFHCWTGSPDLSPSRARSSALSQALTAQLLLSDSWEGADRAGRVTNKHIAKITMKRLVCLFESIVFPLFSDIFLYVMPGHTARSCHYIIVSNLFRTAIVTYRRRILSGAVCDKAGSGNRLPAMLRRKAESGPPFPVYRHSDVSGWGRTDRIFAAAPPRTS